MTATCCAEWAAYVLHTHASDPSAVEASAFIIRRACGVATLREGYMRMVPDQLRCMEMHSGCVAAVEQVCCHPHHSTSAGHTAALVHERQVPPHLASGIGFLLRHACACRRVVRSVFGVEAPAVAAPLPVSQFTHWQSRSCVTVPFLWTPPPRPRSWAACATLLRLKVIGPQPWSLQVLSCPVLPATLGRPRS